MSDTCDGSLQVGYPRQMLQGRGGLVAAEENCATPVALMEREMMEMHLNIEALLPAPAKKVIQFIASRPGEGVSTIVREYAWMATRRLGKSVLILDAHQEGWGQREYFEIKGRYGWDDAVREQAPVNEALTRIGDSGLYLSCVSQPPCDSMLLYDAEKVGKFFESVRTRFDLALVDSPSAATGMDNAVVTRCVDGVVMVVEAERTRWPIIESARDKIAKNGGNILGMVFNKRQNHIPDLIYSRL